MRACRWVVVLRKCVHACVHAYVHADRRAVVLCADPYALRGVFMVMLASMCIDMCIHMHIDICIDLYVCIPVCALV